MTSTMELEHTASSYLQAFLILFILQHPSAAAVGLGYIVIVL